MSILVKIIFNWITEIAEGTWKKLFKVKARLDVKRHWFSNTVVNNKPYQHLSKSE